MQAPDPQTNLSEKITALREQMTAQHNALILKIDEMRGAGPENTLKSLNQSIWNIAGPAPGTTLTDLAGILSKINNGIGGYPDGYVPPGGIPLLNAREYLSQINNSASFLSLILDATGYSGSDTLLSTLKLLLQQFNTSVVYPTMKDLLLTISQQQAQLVQLAGDPLSALPAGVCAEPFVSSGVEHRPTSALVVQPNTVATWDFTDTTEFEAGGLPDTIRTTAEPINWEGYRFYVASSAELCGVKFLFDTRFPTNEWFELHGEGYIGELQFSVDGVSDLKVYICGAGDPLLGACPGSVDPLTITTWWKSAYDQPRPPLTSWLANAWIGGATWSQQVQQPFIDGEIFSGFAVTRSVTSVALCVSWDVSNEPTITRIGIQAFSSGLSEIAQTFQDIEIEFNGTIGSITSELNLSGHEDEVNDIMLIPFVSFSDNRTLPPNVSISISWVEMHLS